MLSYIQLHNQAQKEGDAGYIDPDTGLFVMTEVTLRDRGKCCGNGCRHCPFGRSLTQAGEKRLPELILPPNQQSVASDSVVLFWSGGKDSFLAFVELQKQYENIVWLTSFANDMVGHQEIHVDVIKEQAKACSVPLLLVPLVHQERYEETVSQALALIKTRTLAFGDLHLQGIRAWREQYFTSYNLLFPVWKRSYTELQVLLFSQPVEVYISAVQDASYPFAVGEAYDKTLVERLEQTEIDLFGENGEFHTVVHFL